jgi:pimeloyl-ACP methyl ester carboxylesterase
LLNLSYLKVIQLLRLTDLLIRKYINEASAFMPIDGLNIHYRDEGQGFPIVLLHGSFSSLHTFDAWAEELKQHYRVIRYTLPGFGLTGPTPDDDYSLKAHMEYLRLLLTILGVDRCHLVGSSLGGWIAWETALQFPELVESLTLIGSAGYLDRASIPEPFRLAKRPLAGRVVNYVVNRPRMKYYIRQVYGNKHRVTENLVDRYYELFTAKANPKAFIKLVNQRFKDNTPHLKQIKTPSLIMWGEDDVWVPVNNAYRFTISLPNSQLVTYEGIGHIPMEEIPSVSLKDFRQFLSGL